MNQASKKVLSTFQKLSDESGKLFLPDNQDEAIINNLVNFYKNFHSLDVLDKVIAYFISHLDGEIVRVYDFALVQGGIRDRVEESQADQEDIAKLMKRTREQMEGIK